MNECSEANAPTKKSYSVAVMFFDGIVRKQSTVRAQSFGV